MGYFTLSTGAAADPALEQTIATALLAFQPYSRAISVNHIRETVLLNHPKCVMSAALLNKHIGDLAIRGGYNVHFDGNGGRELGLER